MSSAPSVRRQSREEREEREEGILEVRQGGLAFRAVLGSDDRWPAFSLPPSHTVFFLSVSLLSPAHSPSPSSFSLVSLSLCYIPFSGRGVSPSTVTRSLVAGASRTAKQHVAGNMDPCFSVPKVHRLSHLLCSPSSLLPPNPRYFSPSPHASSSKPYSVIFFRDGPLFMFNHYAQRRLVHRLCQEDASTRAPRPGLDPR